MAIKSRREPLRSHQPVPQRTAPAPMSREDIANVEPVDPDELLGLLSPLTAIDHADSKLFDELDRWTLTEGGER